jgi:hypothetical protein
MDKALEATALQRALGYSYETEKAFQTGVRMTVTETLPPNEFLLKFFLERKRRSQSRFGTSLDGGVGQSWTSGFGLWAWQTVLHG